MAQDRLKERLTGAIALLLLGLVIWFWLLDTGEPAAPVAEETTIPPAPKIETFEVKEPAPPPELTDARPPAPPERTEPTPRADVQPAPPEEPPAVPAPTARAPAAPAEPAAPPPPPAAEQRFALDEEGIPVAWLVQVASLSTVASADKLVAELQAAGFKAYREQVRAGDRTVQRVYVGPKLSRSAAETQRQAIAEQFKLKPLVVRQSP